MSYIYRRRDHNVDFLIDDKYWLKVVLTDGTTATGDFVLQIFNTQFVVADTVLGVDDSAAIVTAMIAAVNADSLPVTAFAGGAANEFYVRFDQQGMIPVDITNQVFNFDAWTTDDDGTITVREIHPEIYRVKNVANWDGVFADIEDVPRLTGFVSSSLQNAASHERNRVISRNLLKRYARFLYDPADYSIDDNHVHFFQIAPVLEGNELDVGPTQIIMTTGQYTGQDPAIILAGTAPAAASFDAATKFTLPARTSSVIINNVDTTNSLALAFGSGTGEIVLAPNETFRDNRINTGFISVRGVGGTADVEVYVSLNTQRTL